MPGFIIIFISSLLLLSAMFFYVKGRRLYAECRKDVDREFRSDVVALASATKSGNVSDADRRAMTIDFLELHSAALEHFDTSLNAIRRKIAAGQTAEVHRTLKSESLLDDYTKMFNESFDRTIFNLFPNFINQINELLHPEKQIEEPDDRRLTTELRVLAFACIGIEDTAMIARFLRLSHNTIYTYRNRMRARALDRDAFDDSLQRIGFKDEAVSA